MTRNNQDDDTYADIDQREARRNRLCGSRAVLTPRPNV